MNGDVENPKLDYPFLSEESLRVKESALLGLKTDILEREPNEVVKQAYRWRLNEKIAEARMLLASERGDMRAFRKYSEFIYGNPDERTFGYTIEKIREDVRRKAERSEDPELRSLAEELLATLPKLTEDSMDPTPAQKVFEKARNLTKDEFDTLLSIPVHDSRDGNMDTEEIRGLFDEALRTIHADGWSTIVNPSKMSISVNHERKTVNVPKGREMTVAALRRLILHEIGTHTERRLNGERSKLMLLGLGLDRNERAEEGIATMREQTFGNAVSEPSGRIGYLGIGLTQGILDGHPRNFREVYEILKRYNKISALASGKTPEEAEKQSSNSAWTTAVRTFRGTDCATKGACFTKDIVYRDGNIATWEIISRNFPEMARFNIGKYDPANDRHIWILEQLNITDKDLERLRKSESA